MRSLDLRKQLQKLLADASEAYRNDFFEGDGKESKVQPRDPSPAIVLVQCCREAAGMLEEAATLGDNAFVHEAEVIVNQIVEMMNKKVEQQKVVHDRIERIAIMLAGKKATSKSR